MIPWIASVRPVSGWITILVAALLAWTLSPASASPSPVAMLPMSPSRLDVPYVPTPHDVVRRMLQMAEVGPDDYLVDLGSGDGRIVIAAVRDWGVRKAYGIDLDPERIREAWENARLAGVEQQVEFEEGDLFDKDFSDATVLTMYLLPGVNMRLRPVIQTTLAPGTRVVSHAFDMGDWEPDQRRTEQGSQLFLWIVPARASGEWLVTAPDGGTFELSIHQTHQKFDGTARLGHREFPLEDTLLRGDQIRFVIDGVSYAGRVDGDRMEAMDQNGVVADWHARRR